MQIEAADDVDGSNEVTASVAALDAFEGEYVRRELAVRMSATGALVCASVYLLEDASALDEIAAALAAVGDASSSKRFFPVDDGDWTRAVALCGRL